VRRDLVDQLPQVSLNVLDLPGELQRQLFDAFQLQIRYDRHRQHVTIKVAIRAEMIDSIGQTAASLAGQVLTIPRQRLSTETETTDRAGAPAPAQKSVPMFDVPPAGGSLEWKSLLSRGNPAAWWLRSPCSWGRSGPIHGSQIVYAEAPFGVAETAPRWRSQSPSGLALLRMGTPSGEPSPYSVASLFTLHKGHTLTESGLESHSGHEPARHVLPPLASQADRVRSRLRSVTVKESATLTEAGSTLCARVTSDMGAVEPGNPVSRWVAHQLLDRPPSARRSPARNCRTRAVGLASASRPGNRASPSAVTWVRVLRHVCGVSMGCCRSPSGCRIGHISVKWRWYGPR